MTIERDLKNLYNEHLDSLRSSLKDSIERADAVLQHLVNSHNEDAQSAFVQLYAALSRASSACDAVAAYSPLLTIGNILPSSAEQPSCPSPNAQDDLDRALSSLADLGCDSIEDITGYRYDGNSLLVRVKGRIALAPPSFSAFDIRVINRHRIANGLSPITLETA